MMPFFYSGLSGRVLMELCLDVGNSHIFGGVFQGDAIKLRFRYVTQAVSSDQFGVFLRGVLRENGIDTQDLKRIGISSVVPSLDYSVRAACIKYVGLEPFVLKAGVKTGLKINVPQPQEVGADLIACAIAAKHHYPGEHVLVADFGTATTLALLHREQGFMGVLIYPGFQTAMQSLSSQASKLPSVPIVKPEGLYGRDTKTAMQTGVYYMQREMLRAFAQDVIADVFLGAPCMRIATGGFAHLFAADACFDAIHPDLAIEGLHYAMAMNP